MGNQDHKKLIGRFIEVNDDNGHLMLKIRAIPGDEKGYIKRLFKLSEAEQLIASGGRALDGMKLFYDTIRDLIVFPDDDDAVFAAFLELSRDDFTRVSSAIQKADDSAVPLE